MKMLLNALGAALLSWLVCVSEPASAADRQQAQTLEAQLKSNSFENRRIAKELAPVKSLQDFHYAQANRAPGMESLDKLSAGSRSQFVNELMFTKAGLASFNYQVLEDSLTYSEAYKLLALFGVQHTVGLMRGLKVQTTTDGLIRNHYAQPQNCCEEGNEGGSDHIKYRCIDRGTCEISPSHICTSNC